MDRSAGVTVNVYFPAGEGRWEGKGCVDKVIGERAQPSTPAPARDEPAGDGDGGGMELRFDPLMLLGIGTAHAQGTPDISLKTPAIQEIQARMAVRFDSSLSAHFDSGALGFTGTGQVAVRDASKIALSERVGVNKAVADQTRDASAVDRKRTL